MFDISARLYIIKKFLVLITALAAGILTVWNVLVCETSLILSLGSASMLAAFAVQMFLLWRRM